MRVTCRSGLLLLLLEWPRQLRCAGAGFREVVLTTTYVYEKTRKRLLIITLVFASDNGDNGSFVSQ
jgi:hypothetical protein